MCGSKEPTEEGPGQPEKAWPLAGRSRVGILGQGTQVWSWTCTKFISGKHNVELEHQGLGLEVAEEQALGERWLHPGVMQTPPPV